MRAQAIGEDEAGERAAFGAHRSGERRQHDVLAVPGNHEQRAVFDPVKKVRGTHRPDRHLLARASAAGFVVEKLPADVFADLLERRLGEHVIHGHDPEKLKAEPLESPPRKIRNVVELVGVDLVHHDADNLDAFAVEERLVQGRLVDRSPDPARRHEHDLAGEQLRHRRVRQVERGADSRMPGAFDNREILLPARPVEGILDPPFEGLVVRLVNIPPCEIRLDRNRAHVLDRHLSAERVADQHAVLVDALAIDFREPLADRLDEPDPVEAFLKARVKAERHRGLPRVLLGRRNENPGGGRVHGPLFHAIGV